MSDIVVVFTAVAPTTNVGVNAPACDTISDAKLVMFGEFTVVIFTVPIETPFCVNISISQIPPAGNEAGS